MNNENIEYIHPNQIGYTELSEEEMNIIKKSEKPSFDNFNGLNDRTGIRVILGLPLTIFVAIYLIFSIGKIDAETWFVLLGVVATDFMYILISLYNPKKVEYTASAHGTVITKDTVMQKVISNRKYTYKKYSCELPITNKPLAEQEFYYLTVRLIDGRYVRYVNCLKKDFDTICVGDTVLAVCFGYNDIRGYLI